MSHLPHVMPPGMPQRPARGGALSTLLVGLLLVTLLGLALWAGLERLLMDWDGVPLNITIDGETVAQGLRLDAIGEGARLLIVLVVLVLLLVAALLLPLLFIGVVAAALVLLMLAIAAAVGAPLIAAASAVLAIGVFVVAPVMLLARLLRRLLRGGRARPSATIKA